MFSVSDGSDVRFAVAQLTSAKHESLQTRVGRAGLGSLAMGRFP